MPQYVALLRGIGPTNPALRNAKLCVVFERLGFTRVRALLTSGNLLFESPLRSTVALEKKIEAALGAHAGRSIDAFVRSEAQINALLKKDPFAGAAHGEDLYLTVTFRKDDPAPVCQALDRAKMKGPEFMAELEDRYGKRITTRTWATIGKIAARMRVAET